MYIHSVFSPGPNTLQIQCQIQRQPAPVPEDPDRAFDAWSTYGRHLPLLASIASRVLAQPGAASWAERNWSVYGQIKSANKSRMQHRTADKLVYCHETLYLQNKLQDAGWKPDVEAHDTDEDSGSDASDEEEDLSDKIFAPEMLALLMQ